MNNEQRAAIRLYFYSKGVPALEAGETIELYDAEYDELIDFLDDIDHPRFNYVSSTYKAGTSIPTLVVKMSKPTCTGSNACGGEHV